MIRIFSFVLLILVSSCSLERKALRIRTPEANDKIEAYYERKWNQENNKPGELQKARKELKVFIKQNK